MGDPNKRVLCTTLITTLLITGSLALASHPEETARKCSTHCRSTHSDSISGPKFKYNTGSSYTYSYNAVTSTFVNGTSNDKSQIAISASAEFFVDSSCEFILQLHDVQLEDTSPDTGSLVVADRNAEFKSALERHPLRFQFNDGVIDELCPDDDELPFALNIKRGILSVFQNSMKRLHSHTVLYEKDVTGVCKTHYEIESIEWYKLLIKKNKNLLNCGNHVQESPMTLSLPTSSTPQPSQLKTQPLIKSTQECTQSITHSGLINTATCHEIHLFKPFSNDKNGGSSGVVTDVKQTILFVSVTPSAVPPKADNVNIRTTLLFDHVRQDSENKMVTEESVYEVLDALEENSLNGVNNNFIPEFSKLVSHLKTLGYPQITKIFSKTDKVNIRKFLLDAMPLVSTADSMTVMRDLFKAKEISTEEMDYWLTSLAFQRKPTIEMISAMKPLLNDGFHAKAMLGISSLVHSYCQINKNCSNESEVLEVMKRIEEYIGDNCETDTRAYKEAVIVALKSIGNTGVFGNSMDKLKNCFETKSNPVEVRLAAISALRRMPCDNPLRSSVLDVYTDIEEDTELRIAGYLTVMQCPSTEVIKQVIDTLYNDEVNQVASFVWTHLTNLQETSSVWKKDVKNLLQNEYLQNKFKTDVIKFSRNYEGSVFDNDLNAGATVESNLIFTPDSYLPRSAALNLTIDLFGETLNIFEVGTRLEGFEQIVERLFGENGYFKDDSALKILQNLMKYNSEESKSNKNTNNNLMNNEIIEYAKDFKANNKLQRKPQGAFYGRVFGNELYLNQFEGLNELFGTSNKINDYQSSNTFFDFTKSIFNNKSVDYTKSMNFLNTNYVIPTIIGLPLQLSVNGSASVGLKFNGESDFKDLFKSLSASMAVTVNPSAAVEVIGIMSIDAFVTQSGLKSINKLNTNTKNEFNFNMKNGEIVELSFGLPKDKMEIIELSSELFVVQKNKSNLIKPSDNVSVEKWDTCSGDRVITKTGLQLCSKLLYNNASLLTNTPYFPLTGPFHYALSLEKTDSFTEYYFKFQKYNFYKDRNLRSMSLLFDTPGSKMNRKFEVSGSLDLLDDVLELSLDTPVVGNYKLRVDYDNNDNKKGLTFLILHDSNQVVNVALGLLISSSNRSGWYKPSLTIDYNNKRYIEIIGNVNYDHGSKYSSNLVISELTEKPFVLAGDLNLNKDKYNADIKMVSPVVEVKAKGVLKYSKTSVSAKSKMQYYFVSSKAQMHTIDFNTKLQRHKRGNLSKEKAHLSLQMSAWPQYNLAAAVEVQHGHNYFNSESNINFGETEWFSKQMYSNIYSKNGHRDFAIKLNLACPDKDLDYKAEIQHKVNKTDVLSYALAQLNSKKRFVATFNHKMISELEQEVNIEISDPWKGVSANGVINMTECETTTGSVSLTYGPHNDKKTYAVNAEHTITETDDSLKHEIYSAFFESDKTTKEVNFNKPFASTNASFYTEYGEDENKTNLYTSVDYRNDIYLIDFNHIKDAYSHYALFKLLRPGTDLSAVLDVQNLVNYKKLSLDIMSHRNISFTIWTHNNADVIERQNIFDQEGEDNDMSVYDMTAGLSFYWDKDNDDNKAIILSVKSNDRTKVGELTLPGQYYHLSADYSNVEFETHVSWGKDKITAKKHISLESKWLIDNYSFDTYISLTTSFKNFENQKLVFNLINSYSKGVLLTSRVEWQKSVTILDYKGHIFDKGLTALLNIKSTIPAINEITLDLACDGKQDNKKSERRHSAALKFSYNNLETSFVGDFIKQKSDYKSDFKFFSAFLDDTRNKISGKFNFNRTLLTFNTTWGNNQSVLLLSNFESPRNYYLQIDTPLPIIRNVLFKVNLINSSNHNYQMESNIRFNDHLSQISLRNIYVDKNLTLLLNLTSTYQDIKLLFSHEYIDGHDNIHSTNNKLLFFANNVKYLSSETNGNISSNYLNKVNLKSVLNLLSHEFVLDLSHNFSDYKNLNSSLVINYNTIYGIDVKMNYEDDEIKKNINTYLIAYNNTVGNNTNNVIYAFKHEQLKNKYYNTLLTLPFNYIIKHDFNFYDGSDDNKIWDNFIEIINSGGTFTKVNKIYNTHKFIKDEKNNVFNVKHDMNIVTNDVYVSTVKLNFTYNYLINFLNDASLSFMLPLIKPVYINYNLKDDGKFTQEMNFTMDYNDDQQLQLTSSLIHFPAFKKLSFRIATPYSKDIAVNSNINFMDNGIKKIKMFLMYDYNTELYTEVQFKENLLNPLLHINIEKSNNLNVFNLNTSYNLLNNFNKFGYFKIDTFDYKILLNSSFVNDKDKIDISTSFVSNLKEFENIYGNIEIFKNVPSLIKLNSVYRRNNDHIRFVLSTLYNKLEKNIDAHIITRLGGKENSYKLQCFSLINLTKSKSILNLLFSENGHSIKFDSTIDFEHLYKKTALFTIETPYEGYKLLSAEANYIVHDDSHKFVAKLHNSDETPVLKLTVSSYLTNDKKIHFQLLSKKDYLNDITGVFEIKVNENDHQETNLILRKDSKEIMMGNLILSYDNETFNYISIKGHIVDEYNINIRTKRLNKILTHFAIDFGNEDNIKFLFLFVPNNHSGPPIKFDFKFDDYKITFHSIGNIEKDAIHHGSVELPENNYLKIKNISFYGKYNIRDLSNWKGHLTFSVDDFKTNFNGSSKNNYNENTELQLTSSLNNFSGFNLTTNLFHKFEDNSTTFVILRVNDYNFNMNYYKNQLKAYIKSPIKSYEEIELFCDFNDFYNFNETKTKHFTFHIKHLQSTLVNISSVLYTNTYWNEHINIDAVFFIDNTKNIKLSSNVLHGADSKEIYIKYIDDMDFFKLNFTYQPIFAYVSTLIEYNFASNSNKLQTLLDLNNSKKVCYLAMQTNNNISLFEMKGEYELNSDKTLMLNSSLDIYSEKIFSVNILCDNLLKMKSTLILPMGIENPPKLYSMELDYDFVESKKVGLLMISYGNEQHKIVGEYLLSNKEYDTFGLLNLSIYSGSIEKSNTLSLQSSYNFGTNDLSSKDFNVRVNIDNDDYFIIKSVMKISKESYFQILLPPLLRTTWLEGVSGRYDFSNDKKVGSIRTVGEIPFKFDAEFNKLNYAQGEVTLNMFIGPNEIQHYVNVTYDLKNEIEVSLELICSSENLMNFKLVFDGLLEGLISLDHQFGESKFNILFNYDFLDITKTINFKSDVNLNYYEFRSSFLFVNSVMVLNINSTIPDNTIKVLGGFKTTEEHFVVFLKADHNDLKKVDIIFSREINDNNSDVKLNFYIPYTDVRMQSLFEGYNVVDVFVNTTFIKDDNLNISNEFTTSIKCSDWSKCASNFQLAGSHINTLSFESVFAATDSIRLNVTGECNDKKYNLYGEYSNKWIRSNQYSDFYLITLKNIVTNFSLVDLKGNVIKSDSGNFLGNFIIKLPDRTNDPHFYELSIESSKKCEFENVKSNDVKSNLCSSSDNNIGVINGHLLSRNEKNIVNFNQTLNIGYVYNKNEISADINIPRLSIVNLNVIYKSNSSYASFDVINDSDKMFTSYASWNSKSTSLEFDSLIEVKKLNNHNILNHFVGKTALNFKLKNKHLSSFTFESPFKYCNTIYYHYNIVSKKNMSRGSIIHQVDFVYNRYFTHSDNYFRLLIEENASKNYAVDFILMTPGSVSRFFNYNCSVMMDITFNSSNYLLDSDIKLYPNDKKYYSVKITNKVNNTINNINTRLEILEAHTELNWLNEMSVKELLSVKSNLPFYDNSTKYFSNKNITSNIEVNFHSKKFLEIDSGFKKFPLINTNVNNEDSISSFYIILLYPGFDHSLCNYKISTTLKNRNNKYTNGNLLLTSLSSIYNLTYVLDDNSFDSNVQLISPEFEHDIDFGYKNQINSNESDINKLIFYFNQNKIITSYKLNDQFYINLKKIEFNINENDVTINGNINIETNISPHFEQIIKYTINDNTGTVRFITRKERNDIKSVLNIESNEVALALTVKANMVDLNPFIEVRCSYGDGESDGYDQTYSAYITYENDDLEINKLIGQIKSPYFGDYFTKITLNKKTYNYFEINVNDYVLLDLRKDSNSGQLYLKFGPSEHHIKYDVIKNTGKNDFYKIVLDADVLLWQINGNVNKENNNINIVTEIGKSEALEKSNFILQLNESNLVLETNIYLAVDTEQVSEEKILMATRLNDKYSLVVNVFNDKSNIHGKIAYDKNYFENILMFSHNKVHPVNSELNFTNPDGTLKALINMNDTNMYSYIGQIDSIDDQFLEFNGGIVKNNEERKILLELKFPTSFSLKLIHFNIMADQHDSEIQKYNFDLYYLSDFNNDKSISDNGVKSMLTINNTYNVEGIFHLTTPFDKVKELDFHIVSKHNEVMNNIYGKFITRLPNYKKYIFTADLLKNTTTVSKLYILSSVLQSFHSSNYSLKDEKQNNVIERSNVIYSFKGTYKSNIINNEKLLYNLLVNWNDKDIAEVGLENLINMKNNYVNLNWFVKTFLPSIERYELELILENKHRKQIIVHLNTPFSLDGHDFDIELFYEYNNITDNNMKMFINIPFVNELQKIGFNIENRINIDRNYIFSNLRIIHKNDLTFGYKISLAIIDKKINADLLVESNENVFAFKLFNERNDNYENILVHIATPLKSFTGAKLDALFNKNIYSGSKLIVEFNNVEYFATNFSRNNDINIAEVKTFNRLLVVNHYYNFNNGYEIYGKVGWGNLNKEAVVSSVETSVKLFGITRKNYFFIGTVLPDFDRSTSLELSSSNNGNEFEYFGKLSLSEDKNFGFKYNKTINNEYETKFILPSKIVKVNYGKNIVLSPNNVKSYYSLNWGKLENAMKKLNVEFNYESLNDNLNTLRRKIIFNHFSLNDRDIEILLVTNKNKINLEIMHSIDEADKFKTEFERWVSDGSNGLSPKDENVISQGINILISHPKSYLYYQLSTNRTLSTKEDNLEVLLKYINEYNVYRSLNIFGNINQENNDMSLNIGTNKNRLNFGVSSWSKDNNYKGFSFKTSMNNKEPLKLETNLNNNAAIEMELDYGNSRSYHLYAGMPNDRLLKAEISHSMYGSQNSDFVTKLQLNTTRLLWGYIEYSPEIYEDFYNNIVTEYEDYGLVLDEIYNGLYSSIKDDKFYNKLQTLIHGTVLNYFEIILEDTVTELEHVFMYINKLNDLFNEMFNNNHYYIKDIYDFFTAGITYTGDKLLLIAQCCMDFMGGILEPFKIVIRMIYTAVEIETKRVKLSTDNIKAMFKTGIENSKELFSSINTTKIHMKEVVINLLQTTRHELNVLEKTIFLEYYKVSLYVSQLYNEMIYNLNLKVIELNKLINQLRMFVDSIEESVFDIIKSIEESLLSVTELRTAVEYYSEYSNWLQNITLHDFVDDFKQFVEQVIELVVEDVHKNFGELKTYLNIASDIVIGNYDTISNTPIGNYIGEIFSKIYYKTKWLWHYSEMQERLQSNLRQLLIDIDKILERFINNLERSATNDDKELETSISVSPDYTSVQFTQELPIDWESFNRIPNFEQLPEYNNVLETANNTADLDKYRYYLYDAISYYTGSDISLASIIPEFGSTAVIAGNHYITFDKVFYDFNGEMIGPRVNCDSLILASDFLNNKFTIIMNYLTENCETKKDSLTILIDNHEINLNFKSKIITVNGKRMEMPMQIGEALIYRDINNIIIDNKEHFLISCNTNYDVCSFKLNGWYFGKTGGLLGTYNNEPVDDFSFANGTTTQYLDRFVSSWVLHSEVNRCTKIENDKTTDIQTNIAQSLTTDFVNNDYNICNNYFESRNSIFSKCFANIQPAPYLHMCSNDMKEISTDTDKFIVLCMISEVYVAQCNSVGIKLNMPPICSRCDSPNNELLFAGSTFYYNDDDTTPPKSTDVVFIVEEDPCVQNVKLSDVISKLDIALSSSGIKNNQYAVIAFNSGSPTTSLFSDKPFIRTVDSNIWSNDIKRFEKAFKRSVYQPSNNIIPTSNDNDNDNTLEMPPAYKALKLASTLKFRPGVSKTFILIQCDKCSKNYIETSYSELMQIMLDLDVTLHILQNKAIDGINGKSSKVFGVDINGAFTGRNVKTLVPSAPLLKQVSIPKDICTPVALETNGTLFNLDKIGKKFMDVWIRRVAQTASPSSCQECNCVQMTDGSSNTLCHKCDTQSTQDVLSEWGSVTNDLDNEESDYDVNQDIDEMEDTIDYDTSKRLLSSLLSIQSAMNNMEKNI